MNFYDEGSATPFLPRSKVVHALRSAYNLILPSERYFFFIYNYG
jgi:hypothetical protein